MRPPCSSRSRRRRHRHRRDRSAPNRRPTDPFFHGLMTMYKAYRTLAALITIGVLISSSSFAQSADDSRRLDEIARNAARQFAAERVAEKEQTRPTTLPPAPGTVVELTLDDSTQRALERNLDIAVERL